LALIISGPMASRILLQTHEPLKVMKNIKKVAPAGTFSHCKLE